MATRPGSTWVIVVAAGKGRRFGRPKQFEQLGGRTVLAWSLETSRRIADGVVVAVAGDRTGAVATEFPFAQVVAGGATRAASVRAGLQAVPPDAEIVVVHDAARPFASPELFEAVISAVRAGADGAIPASPLTDTVKRVLDGRVVETLDRSELVAVQTPQAFRAGALRAAHEAGGEATDDAALVEAAGGTVAVVDGGRDNLKITETADLEAAEHLLTTRGEGLS